MNRLAIATALVLASAVGAQAFDRPFDNDARHDRDLRRVEETHRIVRHEDHDVRSHDHDRDKSVRNERSDRDGRRRD